MTEICAVISYLYVRDALRNHKFVMTPVRLRRVG
jgi:hypothetical protein